MAEEKQDDGKGKLPSIDSMLGSYVSGAMVKGVKNALGIESLNELDDETYEMIFGGMPIEGESDGNEEEEEDIEDYADEEDEDYEEGSEL